ncbi:hypothetical protein C1645_823724 [Glomus cerebriforme]|uniref:Uncharacterized protein n=1 Tax=Glomus cerebriforme TaxID=658196 RepID=A0A397SWX3_9GLOM|nr:hypothetical protein C1645_823724 [Glomus cerebriforme]
MVIINDVELFRISLYKEFVRKTHIPLPLWQHPLVILGGGALAGVLVGPLAIGGLVSALGFTASGIASGSVAAGIMSLYGGAVTAGSACAILQSIGAAVKLFFLFSTLHLTKKNYCITYNRDTVLASGATGVAISTSVVVATHDNNTPSTLDPKETNIDIKKFYNKNKLTESNGKLLEKFLKIKQSSHIFETKRPNYSLKTVIFEFNDPIKEKEITDTFLQDLMIVAPFTSSNIFILKQMNSYGNSFNFRNYILEELRKIYGNQRVKRVSGDVIMNISNLEHSSELKEHIDKWKCKNSESE